MNSLVFALLITQILMILSFSYDVAKADVVRTENKSVEMFSTDEELTPLEVFNLPDSTWNKSIHGGIFERPLIGKVWFRYDWDAVRDEGNILFVSKTFFREEI